MVFINSTAITFKTPLKKSWIHPCLHHRNKGLYSTLDIWITHQLQCHPSTVIQITAMQLCLNLIITFYRECKILVILIKYQCYIHYHLQPNVATTWILVMSPMGTIITSSHSLVDTQLTITALAVQSSVATKGSFTL